MSPHVSLYGDGRLTDAQVLLASEPAANGLLDLDAGFTEFVRPQLLQVSHLASPEEDLRFSKLIFILVLQRENKIPYGYVISWGSPVILDTLFSP